MRGRTARLEATHRMTLIPLKESCEECGEVLWVGYHNHRIVTKLDGLWKLTIVVRRCIQVQCPRYHVAYRPEEEGRWALPHGKFGLEIIALIGQWRFREHRSVPEMHRALLARGVSITERSVTHLMQRYEELVALRVTDQERIKAQLQKQGHVILALDGLQPDVGHEVLWVVRDCLSEEILLARPLLSSTQGDLMTLLSEVKELLKQLAVPVKGIISDGQETIGSAVAFVFPDVPHQLCQFHYLKDATKPLYEADRHAKTEMKKRLRGVRPIERALEEHNTPENEAIRGYCLALRAALTDDGRSPLQPSGLKLYDRVTQVSDSIARVQKKKIATNFKAVAATTHQGVTEYSFAVAAVAERLQAGASSGTDLSQSRTAHWRTGSCMLSHIRSPDAGAESRRGTSR
jgi:MULE transposase domain